MWVNCHKRISFILLTLSWLSMAKEVLSKALSLVYSTRCFPYFYCMLGLAEQRILVPNIHCLWKCGGTFLVKAAYISNVFPDSV